MAQHVSLGLLNRTQQRRELILQFRVEISERAKADASNEVAENWY